MGIRLLLGAARVPITPAKPVPLAGFNSRTGTFEGVTAPLFCNVLWFRTEDEHKTSDAVLVSADLIWWGSDQMRRLRREFADRFGLDKEQVILHATHTHSGPQTSRRFTPSLGKPDDGYLAELEKALIRAMEDARQDMEPVTIRRGASECRIGINRRMQVNGTVTMAPNPDGPVDHELLVHAFSRTDGTLKTVLLHYACHPTTTSENLVSPEFPGVAVQEIESLLGPNTMVLYLQGCCGDIRPMLVRDKHFYRGTYSDVVQLAHRLAKSAIQALNHLQPHCPVNAHICSRTEQILMPLHGAPTLDDLAASVGSDQTEEWRALLLSDPARLVSEQPLELTMLRIGPEVSLLAMDAEVMVEYGLFIKEISQGKVLPLPYSNGMVGYVPTALQVKEGGYESAESIYFFGLPAPFQEAAEDLLKEGIRRLLFTGSH